MLKRTMRRIIQTGRVYKGLKPLCVLLLVMAFGYAGLVEALTKLCSWVRKALGHFAAAGLKLYNNALQQRKRRQSTPLAQAFTSAWPPATRVTALVLTACMVVGLMPTMAFAAELGNAPPPAESGICTAPHSHDDVCGYTAATAEQPCAHEHVQACYGGESICGFGEPALEIVGADEPHTHVQACYELNCPHAQGTHDDACGYAPAQPLPPQQMLPVEPPVSSSAEPPSLLEGLSALPAAGELSRELWNPEEITLSDWRGKHAQALAQAEDLLAAYDALSPPEECAPFTPEDVAKLEGWRVLLAMTAEGEPGENMPVTSLLADSPDSLNYASPIEVGPQSVASSAGDKVRSVIAPSYTRGKVLPIGLFTDRHFYQSATATDPIFPSSHSFTINIEQEDYNKFKGQMAALTFEFEYKKIRLTDSAPAKYEYYVNGVPCAYGNIELTGVTTSTGSVDPQFLKPGENVIEIRNIGEGAFCSRTGGLILGGGDTSTNYTTFKLQDYTLRSASAPGKLVLSSTIKKTSPQNHQYKFWYLLGEVGDDGSNISLGRININEAIVDQSKDTTVVHNVDLPAGDKTLYITCILTVQDSRGDVIGYDNITYTMTPDGLQMLSGEHTVAPQPYGKQERTVNIKLIPLMSGVNVIECKLVVPARYSGFEKEIPIAIDDDGIGSATVTAENLNYLNGDYLVVSATYMFGGKLMTYSYNIHRDDVEIDKTPPDIKLASKTATFYHYTTQAANNKTKAQMEEEIAALVTYSDANPAEIGSVSVISDIVPGVPGAYTATITATDYFGNQSTATLPVQLVYAPTQVGEVTVDSTTGQCKFSGSVVEQGQYTTPQYGFVAGYSRTPTVDNAVFKVTGSGTVTGFTGEKRVLDNVQYYVRGYVGDASGTVYGEATAFSFGTPFNFGTLSAEDTTLLYNHTVSGGNTITIPVTRSGGSEGIVTVNCALSGTAKATLNMTKLTFDQGETTKNITIFLTDDDQFSGSKSFTVRLTNPTPTTINGGDSADLRVTYSTTKKAEQPATGGTASSSTAGGNATSDVANCTITSEYSVNTSAISSFEGAGIPAELSFNYKAQFAGNLMLANTYAQIMGNPVYELKITANGEQLATSGLVTTTTKPTITGTTYPYTSVPTHYSATVPFTLPKGCTTVNLEITFYLKQQNGTPYGTPATYLKTSAFTSASVTTKPQLSFETFVFDTTRTYYPGDVVAIYPVLNYAVQPLSGAVINISCGGKSGTATFDSGKNAFLYPIPDGTSTGTQPLTVSKPGGLTFTSTTAGAANNTASWTGNQIAAGNLTVGGVSVISIGSPTTGVLPRHSATIALSGGGAVVLAQYVWSETATAPATGWLAVPSGGRVTGEGFTGTMYLHVKYSYSGRTATASLAFSFQQPSFDITGDSGATWRNGAVTFALACSSGANAPLTVTASRDGASATVVTGNSYTAAESGRYTFTATDDYGYSKTLEKLVYIDSQAPTATADLSGYQIGLIYPTLSIPVTFGDEGGAGLTFRGYCFSGAATAPAQQSDYTALTVPVAPYTESSSTQTAVYLHLYAKDGAGNVKTTTFGPFKTQKPAATLVKPTIIATYNASTKAIDYTATQGSYNIVWLNGTAYMAQPLSGSIPVTDCGCYLIDVMDAGGNRAQASVAVNDISLEKNPPAVSTMVTNALGEQLPYGSYTTQAQLVIATSDAVTPVYQADGTVEEGNYGGSGVRKVEVSPDGGSTWTELTPNADGNYVYPVAADGSYRVHVTDNNGNTTEKEALVKNQDADRPTVSLSTVASGWSSTAQNITVTYSDAISGVASAQYAIAADTTTTPSTLENLPASGEAVTLGQDGAFYLYYKVTDRAGNVTTGYSALIQVDTQTPTLTVTGGGSGSAALTLSAASTFGASGGTVTVARDGGTGQAAGTSYTITQPGTYIFTATSGSGKTATITKKVYQITFDSAVASQLVVENGVAVRPTDPERIGFALWYWQLGGTEYSFSTPVTGNVALNAVWTLAAPHVLLSVDNPSATYHGGTVVATLTATPSHTVPDPHYTYTWYQDGVLVSGATAPTLPLTTVAQGGSYTVAVTASKDGLTSTPGKGAAVEVTIAKDAPTISTRPTAGEITYGQPLADSPLAPGQATGLAGAVAGTYTWADGTQKPTPLDGGKTGYSVTFTPTDSDNYEEAFCQIALPVAKKVLTPGATADSRAYDQTRNATGRITLTGAAWADTPTATGTFTFDTKDVGTGKQVSATDIALDGNWGDYYTLSLTQLTATANITPLGLGSGASYTPGITVKDIADQFYLGGGALTPLPQVTHGKTTLLEGEDYTLGYTDNVEIGENTALVTITGMGNYQGSITKTFSIVFALPPGGSYILPDGYDPANWVNQPILVKAGAGYEISLSPTGGFGDAVSLGTDGISKDTIYVKDTLTGIIYKADISYQLDSVLPTIQYDAATSGNPTSWTKESTNIFFAAADDRSGIQTVTVTRNGTSYPVTGDYTFCADQNGDYQITITDAAANRISQTVTVNRIDKTPPQLEWSDSAKAIHPAKWYGQTQIAALASDNSGEAPTIQYTAGGQTYENGDPLTAAGIYRPVATALDPAGNTTQIDGLTIRIEPAIDEFVAKVAPLDSSSTYEELVAVKLWHDGKTDTVRDRFTKNDGAVAAYEKLCNLLRAKAADAARQLEQKIAAADRVEDIFATQREYAAVPQEVKDLVSAPAKTQLNQKAADAQAVDNVFSQLARADQDTAPYGQKIAALDAYKKLTDAQKVLAEKNPQATGQRDSIAADVAAIDGVLDLLAAIQKPFTPATKALIAQAKAAYDGLSDKQKTALPPGQADRLHQLEIMRDHAQSVENSITALTQPYTQSEDAAIRSARQAYNALLQDEKNMVEGALHTKLKDLYTAMEQRIDQALQSQQQVAEFIRQLHAVDGNPQHTIADLEALKTAQDTLTAAERGIFEAFDGGTEKDTYDRLKGDLNASLPVVDLLNAIDLAKLTPEHTQQITAALDAYDALTPEQKRLVDEATGGKAHLLAVALGEVQTAHEIISKIPSHDDGSPVGENCPGFSHNSTAHRNAIEEAKLAYERLSDAARKLIPTADKEKLNTEYAGLMRHLAYISTAQVNQTTVEVAGLAQYVELPQDSATAPITVVTVSLAQTNPPAPVPTPAGKSQVLSVDIKLLAKLFDNFNADTAQDTPVAVESIQPKSGQSVLVKLSLPGGKQAESLEIWHVKADGGRSQIQNFWQVTEEDASYVCFEVTSFSHFVLFAQQSSWGWPELAPGPEISQTEHGTVQIAPSPAYPGDQVTIRTKPDAGYVVGKVIVTDKDGRQVPLTSLGNGVYTFTQPQGGVKVTVTFEKAGAPLPWNPFTDVIETDWFYASVRYVYEAGLMNGIAENTFGPHLSTSRAMIITTLWRMEGQPEAKSPNPFGDVPASAYYAKAVAWSAENRVTLGTSATTFSPDKIVTRQEMAAFMARYAQTIGIELPQTHGAITFADNSAIGSWAADAVGQMQMAGIMKGTGSNCFDPTRAATRGEIAAILQRFGALVTKHAALPQS